MTVNWRALRSEAVFIAAVLAVFMVFRTTAYGMYYIPSESMLPTLAVGDRVVVNKMAYGYSRYSIPFALAPDFPTPDGRVFSALPARGDIVVFRHPVTAAVMIKRAIALPGDRVALRDGVLVINGEPATLSLEAIYDYRERGAGGGDIVRVARIGEEIAGGRARAILDRGAGYRGDDFGPVVIPEGAVLVMGDNRDNSFDGRFPQEIGGVGLLPVDHLIGRAEAIAFTLNFARREPGLVTHSGRWFSGL